MSIINRFEVTQPEAASVKANLLKTRSQSLFSVVSLCLQILFLMIDWVHSEAIAYTRKPTPHYQYGIAIVSRVPQKTASRIRRSHMCIHMNANSIIMHVVPKPSRSKHSESPREKVDSNTRLTSSDCYVTNVDMMHRYSTSI